MQTLRFTNLVAEVLNANNYKVDVVVMNKTNVNEPAIRVLTGKPTCPIIYPSEFAQKFGFRMSEETVIPCAALMSHVIDKINDNKPDLSWIMKDKERAEKCIYAAVCNTENNKDGLLADLPHRKICDDLSCYYIIKTDVNGEQAVVKISNDIAAINGWSEQFLYETAIKNVIPHIVLKPMKAIVESLFENETISDEFGRLYPNDVGLYVMTTDDKQYGAGAILAYAGAELQAENLPEVWLIPSSIHEWIVIRKEQLPEEYLTSLIQSVNESVVSASDVLSNHPYQLTDFYA